eukprot:CAMPEP_0172391652 /NCGR_PEP_ID=MMETSP1061-20121228/8007_1 /TAXON_ID=37318 /ORGANISM="Pseudo-nitzschia pungens, Strain cf. pungens" /LENGTH=82 /DNA_ID=CAMNT_0013122325 /DNA_START=88 /DNA_END=333 /DNA_ORIENTATION=+
MQGVLWKRRDVFKNRWRPRWFVLHPRQRMLTYYILSNPEVAPQQLVLSSDNGSVQSGITSGVLQQLPSGAGGEQELEQEQEL